MNGNSDEQKKKKKDKTNNQKKKDHWRTKKMYVWGEAEFLFCSNIPPVQK
jgi:hypothetical protein